LIKHRVIIKLQLKTIDYCLQANQTVRCCVS